MKIKINNHGPTPEIRVASSPQTSDPPPTGEEQQPDQNTIMNAPQNAESPAAAQPQETIPSLSVAPSTVNGPVPTTPGEREQESGNGNLALAQIRGGTLYKVDFDTFEAYCRVKWQYGRHYVNRLISAAQVFT